MTRESAHVAALRAALGKTLADHRVRNGLKQAELAERMYYNRTSISKIETGRQRAPRTFWCNADELLDADGKLVADFDALAAAKASDGQVSVYPDVGRGGRSADVLADALTAAMLPVAQATARVRSTSASPDHIDAVIELEALSRALAEHNRRVLMGDPVDWAEIAERLSQATRTCRRRVVIEPCVAASRNQN